MKLLRIDLYGQYYTQIPVLGASPADQFILKGADGFGPSGVDVLLSEAGRFQGRRPQNKELTLRLGLNPNYETDVMPDDLRTIVYGLLSPDLDGSVMIILVQEDGAEWARINGYVKSVEPVIFAKEPEVQVVISCLSPYFRSETSYGLLDSTNKVNPAFNNVGSARTGFHFEIDFTANTPFFTLWGYGDLRFHFSYDFVPGHRLAISTEPGNRFVSVNGDRSLIHWMDGETKWLMLDPGFNQLATSSQNFNYVSAYYRPKYWGI